MHATSAVLLLALLAQIPDTDQPDPVRLFLPDGQLTTHDLRVFVSTDLSAANQPQLILLGAPTERPIQHVGLARNQEWVYTLGGQRATTAGTLLLFDLQQLRDTVPFYRARVRVTPMLRWTVADASGRIDTVTAIAADPINIGNELGAILWTALVVIVVVAIVVSLARLTQGKSAVDLIRAANGRLSLSRTQVAAWTVAIGAVVLGFGLIRLTVPEIPETLIVLMGLSLGTGGVSYAWSSEAEKQRGERDRWSWGDLLRGLDNNGLPTLSIARAQMLFWTVIILVIFGVKSIGEGQIWPVPWQLVALMGISQAGYLSTKAPIGAAGAQLTGPVQQSGEVQKRRDEAAVEHSETEPTP
jgi:hypothetical protein